MVPGIALLGKLFRRVEGNVHGAAEQPLCPPQRRGQVPEGHAADDEHIDIARGDLLPSCHRPVDERAGNLPGKGKEHVAHDIRNARRLGEKALEFRQQRGLRTGRVVYAVPFLAALEQAPLDQGGKLPLDAGGTDAEVPGEVAQVPAPIGMQKDGS